MKRISAATTALLIATGSVCAAQPDHSNARSCLVEVVYSQELPIGPAFHHTIETTVLVSGRNSPPFQTTVYIVLPWQAPPPRQGQKVWTQCSLNALYRSLGVF